MKILITILGLLNGGYMLLDGIYITINGRYIGTDRPGPWAEMFYKLKIDVYKLGGLFIFYGILWLIWLYALWTNKDWAYLYGLFVSIITLWYLPIGTLFSLIIVVILIFARTKIGL